MALGKPLTLHETTIKPPLIEKGGFIILFKSTISFSIIPIQTSFGSPSWLALSLPVIVLLSSDRHPVS